jgi:hypothetical protein
MTSKGTAAAVVVEADRRWRVHLRGSLMLASALALALASASGCREVADFSTYRDQAAELVSHHAPAFDQLTRRLAELRQRAASLPEVPGAAEARELVARSELAADGLRDSLAGLASKVGSAIKTARPERVEKTLAVATSELRRGLTALRADLDAAAAELALVESRGLAPRAR